MYIIKFIKRILFFILNRLIIFINMLYLNFFNVIYDRTLKINGKLFLQNEGELIIGKNVTINSKYAANPIGGQTFMSIVVRKDALLEIGAGSGISNSAIYCMNEIKIGSQVYIGGNCKIYDTDFHSIYLEDRMSRPEENKKTAPVEIKDGSFIGTGSIVLKGVTIGKESVIAAGSVVSKDIPDLEVWGGNPIKFIKKIIKPLKKIE